MALYRISNFPDSLTTLSRVLQTAVTPLSEVHCTQYAAVCQNRMKNLHVTSIRRYPEPPILPLPTNVSKIVANETGRFTPERARDNAAPVLLYGKNDYSSFFSKPMKCFSSSQNCSDTHVDSYDCFGAISLSGTMQSNVPKPFCSNGKSTHLNMPGGQWARDGKYIAEDMQQSHYRNVCLSQLKLDKSGLTNVLMSIPFQSLYTPTYISHKRYSVKVSQPLNKVLEPKSADKMEQVIMPSINLSKRERFNIIAKDYGISVIVFHVGISIISLGACYAAVAGGIDLKPLIETMYNASNQQIENIVNNSSTFLVAYTIHKLMAPIRFSITLGATPFLVRYLRKMGILKHKKKETQRNIKE